MVEGLKATSKLWVHLKMEAVEERRTLRVTGPAALLSSGVVFLMYIALGKIQVSVGYYTVLFWLLQLLIAVAVNNTLFNTEFEASRFYFKSQFSASQFLLYLMARTLFVQLLGMLITWALMHIMLNVPQARAAEWLLFTIGSVALSMCLVVVGAISVYTRMPGLFMALIGTPTLLPGLVLCQGIHKRIVDDLEWGVILQAGGPLLAVLLVYGVLAFILYPTLWKE